MILRGVLHSGVFLGVTLNSAATSSRCSRLWMLRAVLLGRYRRKGRRFVVRAALPRTVRIAEEDWNVRGDGELPVPDHLGTSIPLRDRRSCGNAAMLASSASRASTAPWLLGSAARSRNASTPNWSCRWSSALDR